MILTVPGATNPKSPSLVGNNNFSTFVRPKLKEKTHSKSKTTPSSVQTGYTKGCRERLKRTESLLVSCWHTGLPLHGSCNLSLWLPSLDHSSNSSRDRYAQKSVPKATLMPGSETSKAKTWSQEVPQGLGMAAIRLFSHPCNTFFLFFFCGTGA
jgi:hypothetical protein